MKNLYLKLFSASRRGEFFIFSPKVALDNVGGGGQEGGEGGEGG